MATTLATWADGSDRSAMVPLEKLCRRIQEISTLPIVATRIIELANSPDSGTRELKEALETDAALSMRVLRCVNSSAYAVRTKINDLQHAIAYLGVKQIRNLALTASVSMLFQAEGKIGIYDRNQVWRHLVSVGICSRMIAMRLEMRHFEEVFLAGLLHDVGIILEDQHVHQNFVQVIGDLVPGAKLTDVEDRHLGFNHLTLGEHVASLWKIPCGVIDSIRHHHDAQGYRGQHQETVRCVEVANYLCSAKGIPSVGLHLVQFPRDTILGLGLGREDLVVLAENLDEELNANQGLFQL